jgi:hypothetical protein
MHGGLKHMYAVAVTSISLQQRHALKVTIQRNGLHANKQLLLKDHRQLMMRIKLCYKMSCKGLLKAYMSAWVLAPMEQHLQIVQRKVAIIQPELKSYIKVRPATKQNKCEGRT